MRGTISINLIICISLIVMVPNTGSGYKEVNTHPMINEAAMKLTGLNSYLTQRGSPEGIDTWIDGKKAVDWIRFGGEREDVFPNGIFHFHEPLKSWDKSGIFEIGFSSLLWAQDHTLTQPLTCDDMNVLNLFASGISSSVNRLLHYALQILRMRSSGSLWTTFE